MWSIRLEQAVSAAGAVVWPYLATPARYGRWACPGVDHYDVRFTPRAGATYVEEYRHGDREYQVTGTVAAFEPPHRLAFHRLTPGSAFGPAEACERSGILFAPLGALGIPLLAQQLLAIKGMSLIPARRARWKN